MQFPNDIYSHVVISIVVARNSNLASSLDEDERKKRRATISFAFSERQK